MTSTMRKIHSLLRQFFWPDLRDPKQRTEALRSGAFVPLAFGLIRLPEVVFGEAASSTTHLVDLVFVGAAVPLAFVIYKYRSSAAAILTAVMLGVFYATDPSRHAGSFIIYLVLLTSALRGLRATVFAALPNGDA